MVESSSSQPPSFSCSNGAQKSNLDKYSSMSSIYDDQVCDFKLSCLKTSEIFKIFCKILEFEIDNTYKRTYPGKLPFKKAMFRQKYLYIYLKILCLSIYSFRCIFNTLHLKADSFSEHVNIIIIINITLII